MPLNVNGINRRIMHKLKDILMVTLLMVLVFMTCCQEGDILKLRHRVFNVEGGLVKLYGWITQDLQKTNIVGGGLAPAKGGLGLRHFLSCTASLHVTEAAKGPISFGTKRYRGTAVFVSDNILLTAKHNVEDRINDASVILTGHNGMPYIIVEILEDKDDDLAMIIIQGRYGPWLSLGSKPRLGDDVICIGTPLNHDPQLIITWGRVSSEKYQNTFIYDGFCWGGCSGGPVIIDGKLVGITEARLSKTASIGFAVPIERLDPELLARIIK